MKGPIASDRDRSGLFRLIDHLEETGQKLELYQIDDFTAVVGYNGQRYVLPSETVTALPLRDYSVFSGDALKLLGAETRGMALPAVPGETAAAVTDKKEEAESRLRALDEEMKAVKNCTSADMADLKVQLDMLQAQIKERQEELMACCEKNRRSSKRKRKNSKKSFSYWRRRSTESAVTSAKPYPFIRSAAEGRHQRNCRSWCTRRSAILTKNWESTSV